MKESGINRKKVFLLSSLIFLLIAGVVFLCFTGNFWAWLWFFPDVGDKIQEWTGIGYWPSRVIGIVVTLVAVLYLPWMISFRPSKRRRAFITIAIACAIFCVGMSIFYANRNFDPPGNPAKCVALNPYGEYEEVACGNKFHPIYGTPVIPQSSELVIQQTLTKQGPQQVSRIVPDLNTRLFGSDGKPLFWYYQHADGRLEFFGASGHHPVNNAILAPVNPEVVALLYKYLSEGKANMIITNENSAKKVETTDNLAAENQVGFPELRRLRQALNELGGEYGKE